MSVLRKFGYRPSRNKAPHVRHLLGALLSPLPDAASLEALAGPVQDQGQTGSCVGQALASAVYARAGAMGAPCPWPSAASLYTGARCEERGPTTGMPTPLADDGCSPEDAITWATTWGVASNAAWPFVEQQINEEPPLFGLEDAACFFVTEDHSIPCDDAAPDLVAQALAAGYPVTRGGPCGDELQHYPGGDAIVGAAVNPQGGHATCVVGYDHLAPDGSRRWRVKNSWSTGWGDSGYFWGSDAWILDSSDLDIIVGETRKAAS